MKTFKKFAALIVAMLVVLAMSSTAMAGTIVVEAGTTTDGDPSQDVLIGETYNAYKILNYTSDGDAYSYFLTTAQYDKDNANGLGKLLESVGFTFTASADGTQYFVNNADDLDDPVAIADGLYAIKDKIAAVAIATDSETATADKDSDGKITAKFEGLDTGYWFVTSSLGALCSLQSYDDEALIVEKNQKITPPEKVASDSEFQVGDTITYTITYTDVKGTNNILTLEDTMSAGLTYKASTLKVKVNGTDTTTGWTATPTADAAGATLTIIVDAATMNTLQEGETIVVTYDAQVNDNASLDGTEVNTVVARTSNQKTTPTKVVVESSDLTVNKTDGTNALKGAMFELYRTLDEDGTTAIHELVHLRQLTAEEAAEALGTTTTTTDPETGDTTETFTPGNPDANTVYYVVDTSATNTDIDMAQKDPDTDEYIYSSARIFGIDKDSTYSLLETKAPEGYNQLDEEVPVGAGLNTIDVTNEAGSVLPSTGGMGTTILYTVGGILVLAAAVIMITRRRVRG